MVSAFKALNEIVQTRQGSGMVLDWKQVAGTLLVGGDSRIIKTWDAQTECQGMVRVFRFSFSRVWPDWLVVGP